MTIEALGLFALKPVKRLFKAVQTMTTQIQVTPDSNEALHRQHIVESRVKDMIKGTKGYFDTEDYPCPGFDVFPESPEQADEIIAEIEANYPDFVLLYD